MSLFDPLPRFLGFSGILEKYHLHLCGTAKWVYVHRECILSRKMADVHSIFVKLAYIMTKFSRIFLNEMARFFGRIENGERHGWFGTSFRQILTEKKIVFQHGRNQKNTSALF